MTPHTHIPQELQATKDKEKPENRIKKKNNLKNNSKSHIRFRIRNHTVEESRVRYLSPVLYIQLKYHLKWNDKGKHSQTNKN